MRTSATAAEADGYAALAAKLDALARDMAEIKAALLKPKVTEREWRTTKEAAARAGVGSEQCIRDWCVRYGVGEKVGGRWRVDAALLDALLADRGR